LSKLGLGEIIYDLRKKILDVKSELNELGISPQDMPELITSSNLLRSNEHLTKVSKKQSELIFAYEQYSMALEDMNTAIFDIQNDLKNLLKEQSKLISDGGTRISSVQKKKKSISKRKSTKK